MILLTERFCVHDIIPAFCCGFFMGVAATILWNLVGGMIRDARENQERPLVDFDEGEGNGNGERSD